MKRRLLLYYDKLIIATILAILSLFGCSRKNYIQKETKQAESIKGEEDSSHFSDTIRVPRKQFDDKVIAMYGVQPTRDVE